MATIETKSRVLPSDLEPILEGEDSWVEINIGSGPRPAILPPTILKGDLWESVSGTLYCCHIAIIPDEEGGYCATVPDLPGVVAEGDTPEETHARMAESLGDVLRTYAEQGMPVPWLTEPEPVPDDAEEWSVLVNV